jgi:hypothetical protein
MFPLGADFLISLSQTPLLKYFHCFLFFLWPVVLPSPTVEKKGKDGEKKMIEWQWLMLVDESQKKQVNHMKCTLTDVTGPSRSGCHWSFPPTHVSDEISSLLPLFFPPNSVFFWDWNEEGSAGTSGDYFASSLTHSLS